MFLALKLTTYSAIIICLINHIANSFLAVCGYTTKINTRSLFAFSTQDSFRLCESSGQNASMQQNNSPSIDQSQQMCPAVFQAKTKTYMVGNPLSSAMIH